MPDKITSTLEAIAKYALGLLITILCVPVLLFFAIIILVAVPVSIGIMLLLSPLVILVGFAAVLYDCILAKHSVEKTRRQLTQLHKDPEPEDKEATP